MRRKRTKRRRKRRKKKEKKKKKKEKNPANARTRVGTSEQLGPLAPRTRLTQGRSSIMAEHESLEYGKADFVLLDTVSMEEFMGNLKLR